jgi:uncharacterized caspase-like protein
MLSFAGKASLIAAGLALIVGALARAQEVPRYALVVGNSAYAGDSALKNPANDAADMAAALKKIGWIVALVTDADRRSFNRAINAFRDNLAAHEGADALFYFAGHGMQVEGSNYLIPVKTEFETLDDVKADAIGVASVAEAIEQGKAGVSLLILDACRDNPFVKRMSRSLSGSRGLTVVQKGGGASGSAVMFATSPGDVALDGSGRNGIFTGVLLEYIESDLKLEDLFKKVTGEVRDRSAGSQNPWINASLREDFYFVSTAVRQARAAEVAKAAEEARRAEIAKATEAARADEAAKTAAAQKEAEAARLAAAAAIAASQARGPKGKLRIESSVEGRVFMGTELLGDVAPDMPLMSDSLDPGRREFRFVSAGSPDEVKSATIGEKAYAVILFGPATASRAAANAAPGAIEVRVSYEGLRSGADGSRDALVSLDGGKELPLPYIFEGVSAGSHVIRISDEHVGNLIYPGLEESVTVEPGKRLSLTKSLVKAQAAIRVNGIPEGAILRINDTELRLEKDSNGTMHYAGKTDAGAPKIEVTKGMRSWSLNAFLPKDGSGTFILKDMPMMINLERRSIRLKGKAEDWAGIEPIFGAAQCLAGAKNPGFGIVGATACRDEKNLYLRIDLADKPSIHSFPDGALLMSLRSSNQEVHLNLSAPRDGSVHTSMYDAKRMQDYPMGSYAVGTTFIEMSFPLSRIAKYIDFSTPALGEIGYWRPNSSGWYATDSCRFIIGR